MKRQDPTRMGVYAGRGQGRTDARGQGGRARGDGEDGGDGVGTRAGTARTG